MTDSLSGAARPASPGPVLPRAVLLALCAWLCVVAPLAFALEAQAALPRLALYGAPAWTLFAWRAVVVVLGVFAGRLLWRGEPAGLRLAAAWALLSAATALLTAWTPYFPGNRPPSLKRLVVGTATLMYLAAAVALAIVHRRR